MARIWEIAYPRTKTKRKPLKYHVLTFALGGARKTNQHEQIKYKITQNKKRLCHDICKSMTKKRAYKRATRLLIS